MDDVLLGLLGLAVLIGLVGLFVAFTTVI